MPQKGKKTASVHDLDLDEYKMLQHEALDWGKSLSGYLKGLIKLGKVVLKWLPPSNLDLEDAVALAGGGVPDRFKLRNFVEAFKKEYCFDSYDSALKYQRDVKQWKLTNGQKRRFHEILDELLDEELEWVEHVLDEFKS